MFGCHGDPRPFLLALAADQRLQKLGFVQGVGVPTKMFPSSTVYLYHTLSIYIYIFFVESCIDIVFEHTMMTYIRKG